MADSPDRSPLNLDQQPAQSTDRPSEAALAAIDATDRHPQSPLGAELFQLGVAQLLVAREQLFNRR